MSEGMVCEGMVCEGMVREMRGCRHPSALVTGHPLLKFSQESLTAQQHHMCVCVKMRHVMPYTAPSLSCHIQHHLRHAIYST